MLEVMPRLLRELAGHNARVAYSHVGLHMSRRLQVEVEHFTELSEIPCGVHTGKASRECVSASGSSSTSGCQFTMKKIVPTHLKAPVPVVVVLLGPIVPTHWQGEPRVFDSGRPDHPAYAGCSGEKTSLSSGAYDAQLQVVDVEP